MEGPRCIRITRTAFEFMREASKRTAPYEFIGLLRKNMRGEVAEVLVIPESVNGEDFSSINPFQLTYTSRHSGSVHSHPAGGARPSDEDLAFFRAFGDVHVIVSAPYTLASTRAYDGNGKRLLIRLV